MSEDDLSDAVEVFDGERRRLFGIAYRMLGTVSDAEDIVQECWIRWQGTDRARVTDPAAFLTTIATRLAINVLQSARHRRETYIGPWLPEPVTTDGDPALGAERADALQTAILFTLEKLTPAERAAYILREAFDYPYPRIAEVISTSVVNARQLVSRARSHLTSVRRTEVEPSRQRQLLEAFLVAARQGDAEVLESLFAEDVVSYTDGNGIRLAARTPVHGRSRVARFVAAFPHHFWTGKQASWVQINGQNAVALTEDGAVTAVITISATEDGIRQLQWMMSPDKLGHVLAERA